MIRAALAADQSYVARGWTASLASAGAHSRKTAGELVDRVLDDARVRIAVSTADDGHIRAWLAYSPLPKARVVHWAYTRKLYRGQGDQRALLQWAGLGDSRPLWWTMRGPDADELLARYTGAVHVPIEGFLS